MKQDVHDNKLKYQDLLILAYFKANYKKYEFNEIAKMMGMVYAELGRSIDRLLELGYLIYIKENIVISKNGECLLEEKGLENFFGKEKRVSDNRKQISIDEPYIPIKFNM